MSSYNINSLLRKYKVSDVRDLPWTDIWYKAIINHRKEHPKMVSGCSKCEAIKYVPENFGKRSKSVMVYGLVNGRTRVRHKLNGMYLRFKETEDYGR